MAGSAPQGSKNSKTPACLWKREDEGVRCLLCSHFCKVMPGDAGLCGVRVCEGSPEGPVLYTLVGDNIVSANLDPVEKKPLYHFMPCTMTYSFGAAGCNFSCAFCQNWTISRLPADERRVAGRRVSPKELVAEALSCGAASISYTYTEPGVFFELMVETADRAAEAGLASIMVSNGFQSPKALRVLERRIQAANIDLKGFSDRYYREICGGRLKPVLRNLRAMAAMGWWLEITTLLVPGLNDNEAELRDLARFIRDELGPDVPWHISRFRPEYRLRNVPPTPTQTLERAWRIGREEGLSFVYIGNLAGHAANSTYCPKCGELFARRAGFATLASGGSRCGRCGASIAGLGWEKCGSFPEQSE